METGKNDKNSIIMVLHEPVWQVGQFTLKHMYIIYLYQLASIVVRTLPFYSTVLD